MSERLWPRDQLFLAHEVLNDLCDKCKNPFVTTCQNMNIEEDLSPLLVSVYLPLAAWLDRRQGKQDGPLVVGLCGAQGSGKSTAAELLKTVLIVGFERRLAAFSLDDLYKTKSEREIMSRTVHPLFVTRGVPGTHDVGLGIETVERLKTQRSVQSTPIPVFDKARDDRQPRLTWPSCSGPVDVIIFEGWCVGALPQSDQALATPINDLEREEDADGAWRTAVNRALAQDYQRLFALIDVLLMIKVDSMERVFEWRHLQEHKLAKKATEVGLSMRELRIMSDHDLNRFIMHFERITRHMLVEMPQRADLVLSLDPTHQPAKVLINKPITP